MTEFDELLKQKVEQTDYPYRHTAWRHFLRRSGLHTVLTGGQIAAVSLTGAAVATLVTWGVVRHTASSPTPAEPAPAEVAVVTADSNAVAEDTLPITVGVPEPMPSQPAVTSTPKATSPSAREDAPQPAVRPTTKPITDKKPEPIHGRPVIINVDTITELFPTDEQIRKGHSNIIVE